MVFQDDRLFPHLTVWNNLKIINQDIKRIEKLLEICQVSELKHHYPKALSGGEKQRISIIRAFLKDAPIVLMDEPFKSLDFNLKMRLVELVKTIQAMSHKTIILVTHDLDIALYLGHELFVLTHKTTQVQQVMTNPYYGLELNEESITLRQQIKQWLL
jgi:NitT/TauT family transport system ATP-binding protein